MRKSVGFRNLSLNEYYIINWEIVYRVATTYLDDFKGFARPEALGLQPDKLQTYVVKSRRCRVVVSVGVR